MTGPKGCHSLVVGSEQNSSGSMLALLSCVTLVRILNLSPSSETVNGNYNPTSTLTAGPTLPTPITTFVRDLPPPPLLLLLLHAQVEDHNRLEGEIC